MKTMNGLAVNAVAVAMLLGLSACSEMSARDESTAKSRRRPNQKNRTDEATEV